MKQSNLFIFPENITIKLPKLEIMVKADPFQLQIVFNNILINAVQAIGNKKGLIVIQLYENADKAIIEIENSGPSISKEVLPHIF